MKKSLIVYIAVVAVVLLSIFISHKDAPQGKNNVTPAPEPNVSEPQHISEQLTDGLYIDADVPSPTLEKYSSYTLGKLSLESETAKAVFFPENGTVSMVYTDAQGNAYESGDYAIFGENGERLSKSRYNVSFNNAQYQQHLEIEDLLDRYAEKYPEEKEHSLAFMSREEALALGASTIQALGIPFTPVADVCIGLEHNRIMAWQQELLNDKSSYYDPFGKAIILSRLDDDDDAYYLRFSFSYKDISIFGVDSPDISFADAVFPPSAAYAKMLITANGIEHFDLYPAYVVSGVKESGPIISPEDAIAKVKESYENMILFGKAKIISICIEYIPFETAGQTVLRPYWCLSIAHENTGEDGKTYWSDHLTAERINAFTGEDLKYGG